MNIHYQDNRTWSDNYIPAMKQIIGPYLLVTSSFAQDTQQACDLICLKKHVACRIRRCGYLKEHKNEFTLRFKNGNSKTEYAKILEGFADWIFYAHVGNNNNIDWYWLLDLDIFRTAIVNGKGGNLVGGIKANYDNCTSFAWFDITSFPKSMVIGSGSYYVNK